jgi:hypothetical protein
MNDTFQIEYSMLLNFCVINQGKYMKAEPLCIDCLENYHCEKFQQYISLI